MAQGGAAADPAAKLSLLAAAFADNGSGPSPERTTAMAFLPGRGVVKWDVTGLTPEQAREAQVEAMGAADARAVQREIDLAAEARAEEVARAAAANQTIAGGLGLRAPSLRGFPRQTAALALRHGAGEQARFSVRSGDSLRGRPRMYAFAAVSDRSIGLNVLQDEAGWKNGGVTTDREVFTGQRQAGLAWRKGLVRTSLSYVQQKDHTQVLGVQTNKDHRLMLTMAVQPQAIAGLFGKAP